MRSTKFSSHANSKRMFENISSSPRRLDHIVMALFGAGSAIAYDVGIRLYISEIVSIAMVVFYYRPGMINAYKNLSKIVFAYVMWMTAIIISDIFNATEVFDFLRNFASPLIGGISLVFVTSIFSRTPSSLLTYLFFVCLFKAVFGEAQYGDAFSDRTLSIATVIEDANYFKVRIDPFLTPGILLAATVFARKNLKSALTLLFFTGVIYLYLDDRSMGIVFLATATVGYYSTKTRMLLKRELFLRAFVSVIFLYATYASYVYYTLQYNVDGHGGKQLTRIDNPYNPTQLLFQGRSEWLVMPDAIAERPFFGWGSWAQDTGGRFNDLLLSRTQEQVIPSESLNYIPSHSLLGSAWVWSGILGFFAVARLLLIIIGMWRELFSAAPKYLPIAIFFYFNVLWDLLFSPPQQVRLAFPILLGLLIVVGERSRQSQPAKSKVKM